MAEKKKQSFKVGEAPWEKQESPASFKVGEAPWEQGEGDPALALVEGVSQGATFGYHPQVMAASEVFADPLSLDPINPQVDAARRLQNINPEQVLTPESLPEQYLEKRDDVIRRLEGHAENNPAAYYGGQLTGTIATSMIPGKAIADVAKGGKMATLAKSAMIGGAEAAAMNPGDVIGEFNPLQIKKRIDAAKDGAMFSGAAGAISKGAQATLRKSKDLAEKIAFKSSGAMLKDFRQAGGKDEINDLGRFMLDKILKTGDTFEDVERKAGVLKEKYGQEIGQLYSEALQTLGDTKFWTQKVSPGQSIALKLTQFMPGIEKKRILEQVSEKLGDSPDKNPALRYIAGYLDELHLKYGVDMDLVTANAVKGKIDEKINYAKRAIAQGSADMTVGEKQEALFVLRNYIRDKIESHLDVLDNVLGTEKVKKLREANKAYGAASTIHRISDDRVFRESTNRTFSLGDRIMGGAGMAGVMAGTEDLSDPYNLAKVGTVALGGAALSKMVRTRGPHALAKFLDTAAKAKGIEKAPGMASSVAVRMLKDPEYSEEKMIEGYKESRTVDLPPDLQEIAEAEIENSDISSIEKANRLNLLRRHGKAVLDE